MTHQNHQTNGASLEDCHTNFFALTELYGIKWRKLVWGESAGGGDGGEGGAPLADPVISSYARCLAGDILCVWRRVPQPQQTNDIYEVAAPAPPPPLSLRAAKELWIFWYGEEPDLNGLVAPELIASQGDQGSWESGLSYECRSLLFKALHNLIERCLLSRDFVRLGKWFVQPYDGDEEDVGKSPWHLSFSFAFFLHGESTVCASVDVRQHPPVRTLTPARLAALARASRHRQGADKSNNKVILAPYGLEGVVTGRTWSDSDAPTARLLDAWRQLYPLEQGCSAVEVICSDVRMRYPVPYVLVTEMEAGGGGGAAPPPAPAPPAPHPLAHHALAALTTPAPHQPPEVCYVEAQTDKEDFCDPTRKATCTCAKSGVLCPSLSGAVSVCALGVGAGGGVSPLSAPPSPAPPASAPPSAGPPPPSPHPSQTPTNGTSCVSQAVGAVPPSLHTPAPTPDPLAPPTPAPPPANPPKPPPLGDSPLAGESAKCDAGAEWWRRPVLPAPPPAPAPPKDDHALNMLYDYTTVHAWLEHPVKRFKGEETGFVEEMALGAGSLEDLYSGHDHTKMAATPDHRLADVKQEKHEDEKEYKNLFTSDGLCPTLKDLEQIFDNSDDAASGDETVRLLASQSGDWKCSDDGRGGGGGGGGCVGRCVRAEELSKMFPTPPSLEAHAQPSPGFTLPDDATPQPHRMHAGSPPPDPIEDWSYVFKPPTVYKYVGSSKYAPLTTLPSQLLPPVVLPPNAVYRPRPHAPAQPTEQTESAPNRTAGVKRSGSPIAETPKSRAVARSPRAAVSARTPCGGGAGGGAGACPSPASPARRAPPHACPLLVNVLLADTVLNVFRDHNFDSCTLCVCNAESKVVGNIRGADYATYLWGAGGEEEGGGGEDEPARCTCGFSAILNRRLAHRAGLFYEDEMEITGLAEEPTAESPVGGGVCEVAGAVVRQCAALAGGPASALARAARRAAHSRRHDHLRLNLLEYSDGGAAAVKALRAATCGAAAGAGGAVHRWPFIGARAPRSSRDVVRLMRRLRPLLQDAIQKRCCGARMWDGVTGPLTWRQFHRLAGRGNEDLCEPQPVPSLLVGHDRDWLALSPYALRHWERLALEPYSYSRDVAYVVLAADGDSLTDPLRTFFRELTATYEACRLGRHQPITKIARDGIVRTAPAESPGDAPRDDEWAGEVPPGRLGEYVRAYADALRALVPQLAALTVDRSLFETERERDRVPASPMRPPSTPDHPATPSSQGEPEEPSSGGGTNGGGLCAGGGSAAAADEEGGAALVVYVVEPPAAAARPAALRALLRLAAKAHQHLQHHNPLIKIISLEGVCESWCGGGGSARRALAMSVFTAARRTLRHKPTGKSLTGFGTAANDALFLSNKDEKNRLPYAMFSPAWVLGVSRRGGRDAGEAWLSGGGAPSPDHPPVLFVAYCLSHDQRWLLAAATDARGELLDTAIINIHVPPRCRRRGSGGGGLARRLGLTKLMDFTLGVMSQAAQPWRLVVGRVGRIGHGELKGWSWLLSRKNLTRASNVLREICNSCSVLYPSGVPCILSACLVSTEPDSCLRLMADRFTPDERFSQASIQSHLHTPRDVTATHILVFPTSATTQSNQMPFEPPMANGEDNDMMFLGVDMDEDIEGDNMTDLIMGDMIFGNMWAPGSPRRHDEENSRDGSPASARHAQHANAALAHDQQAEQVGTVLQQPLALGYLVSTAPLAGMPAWWWAGCSHLRDACPAFLKNALHLHAGNVQSADDLASFTSQRRDHNVHPLDSQTTTDVLRYVLEGYNALSWLSVDGITHDRMSCLPFHVQVLMQLYHTAAALG